MFQLYGEQLLLFDQFSGVDVHNFCDFVPMLEALWADPDIQTAFDRRAEYQVGRQTSLISSYQTGFL